MNGTVLILLSQTNLIEVHSFTNIWFNVYILTHVCVVAKKKVKLAITSWMSAKMTVLMRVRTNSKRGMQFTNTLLKCILTCICIVEKETTKQAIMLKRIIVLIGIAK